MESTEITLVTGERCVVQGSVKTVEAVILAASRGSIMQLAWLTDAASGRSIGINPACIVSLRALGAVPVDSPVSVPSGEE